MQTKNLFLTQRGLEPNDREPLRQLLAQIPCFDREDQFLAMDLINIALGDPNQQDYRFVLATGEGDLPMGYACFGPAPLTQGTFSLYWIAVNPVIAGQGIGTTLLQWVENEVRACQGRMILLETSSCQEYAQTRRFYLKNGYTQVETIPDYYRVGEERVTFMKRLG